MGLKDFNRKQIILLVTLLLIVIAIPVTLYLSQKNQIFKPRAFESQTQTHFVINFNPKVEQILSPGDTLEGKGIPNAKVSVSITPDGATGEVTADKEGKWTYQIPSTIQPKNYNLTITIEDVAGNIASIKTYKVRIGFPTSSSFNFIKPAYAQGDTSTPSCPLFTNYCPGIGCIFFLQQCQVPSPSPTPTPVLPGPTNENYGIWETQMRAFGIYPAYENGEIVLYNEQTYKDKYCSQNPCIFAQTNDQIVIGRVRDDTRLLTNLLLRLKNQNYDPYTVLEPYFPNIRQLTAQRLRLLQFYGEFPLDIECPALCTRTREIDAQTLAGSIEATYNDMQWNNIRFNETIRDPFKLIIVVTDPVFGTRSMVDLLTQPIDSLDRETIANGLLGFTFLVGMSEKVTIGGLKLAADSAVNVPNMVNDVRGIRNSVRGLQPGQQGISLAAERPRVAAWVSQSAARRGRFVVADGTRFSVAGRTRAWGGEDTRIFPPSQLGYDNTGLIREGPVPVPVPRISSFTASVFEDDVMRAMRAGRGGVVSRSDVLQYVVNNDIRVIQEFERRTGRNLGFARDQLNILVAQGNAYVVGDEYMRPGAAGYFNTAGNYIVIQEGSYYSNLGLHTLHHEVIHMSNPTGSTYARGFIYGGYSELDKTLTGIYELMTDFWADLARGVNPYSAGSGLQSGGYIKSYSDLYKKLINRFRANPQFVDDSLEFAITGDANKLLSAFNGNVKANNFLARFLGANKASYTENQRFLAYFRHGMGIDWSRARYSPSLLAVISQIQQGEASYVEPALEFDDGFILDNYEGQEDQEDDVTIDNIQGQAQPGGNINVHVLETEGGIAPSIDQFREVFELQSTAQSGLIKTAYALVNPKSINEIRALSTYVPAQEDPPNSNTYSITIPASEIPGRYNLIAYMYRQGSDQILDSDSEPITITSVTPTPTPTPTSTPTGTSQKTITSILINNQPVVDISNPEATVTLPGLQLGVPGLSYVPVQIYYSDGTNRFLTLTFNYLNYTSPGGSIPSPSPLASPTPSSLAFGGCSLTADSSSTAVNYVDNGTLFVMAQIPAGAASARWGGTNTIGGVMISIPVVDMEYFLQSLNGNTFTKYIGPYQDSNIGSYTRYITVFDSSGGTICQSNPVNIFVIARSSGGTTYPTPPTGGGSTFPTPTPYTVCTFGNCNPAPTPTPTPSCLRGGSPCNLNNQSACCSNQCTGNAGSATCSYPFR